MEEAHLSHFIPLAAAVWQQAMPPVPEAQQVPDLVEAQLARKRAAVAAKRIVIVFIRVLIWECAGMTQVGTILFREFVRGYDILRFRPKTRSLGSLAADSILDLMVRWSAASGRHFII